MTDQPPRSTTLVPAATTVVTATYGGGNSESGDPGNNSKSADPRQRVTPHAFLIAPHLLGKPLATPAARAWAWAIDGAVVGILSQAGPFLLALALAALSYQLISKRGQASPFAQTRAGKLPYVLVAIFVGWAALSGLQWLSAETESWQESDQAAVDIHLPTELENAIKNENTELLNAAALELEKLRSENEQLKANDQGFSLIETGKKLLDDVGFGFGWAAVYFSLLTAWWKGQTLGKKVAGLRVVQLNGKPLTVWDCFNRYGGYAAGFATGLLGFAQIFWDDNRQGIHDKISFTVVLDEKRV